MKAMIIDEAFTATSEQQMRDFADAWDLYMKMLAIADDDKEMVASIQRGARKAMGKHYETSRKCWELMYG